jgi:hypothetical protein
VAAALNKPGGDTEQSPEALAALRARLAALREALVQADAQEKEILARCQRVGQLGCLVGSPRIIDRC